MILGASYAPLNSMEDHHGSSWSHHSARAVEQGQDRQSEDAIQAQGHLGVSRPPLDEMVRTFRSES